MSLTSPTKANSTLNALVFMFYETLFCMCVFCCNSLTQLLVVNYSFGDASACFHPALYVVLHLQQTFKPGSPTSVIFSLSRPTTHFSPPRDLMSLMDMTSEEISVM